MKYATWKNCQRTLDTNENHMKIDTNVMMWYYNVDVFFEDFYTGGWIMKRRWLAMSMAILMVLTSIRWNYDENGNLISADDTSKGTAWVKLSTSRWDWAGFDFIGCLCSGMKRAISLENYRSGPLYLVVQNSNAAIKYIEITSIILRDDGR